MEVEKIYTIAKNLGLSPNEYTYLVFLHKGIKEDVTFNEQLSKRLLIKAGYLSKSGQLTEKANNLFNIEIDNNQEDAIDKFRNLFPKGILPNGRPAKSGRSEVASKFAWFTSAHGYPWSVILKATEDYVKYYQKQGYKFMQTASNFISKTQDKIRSSALAEWCEKVNSGEEINDEFDINV